MVFMVMKYINCPEAKQKGKYIELAPFQFELQSVGEQTSHENQH